MFKIKIKNSALVLVIILFFLTQAASVRGEEKNKLPSLKTVHTWYHGQRKEFLMMAEDEMAALLDRTVPLSKDGQYEEYKTYEPDPTDDW